MPVCAAAAHDGGFSLIEMLLVLAIMGVLATIAVPMSGNAVRYIRISGDARDISNALAVTKMRAASKFTKARLLVDLSSKSYYVQTYNKTANSWTSETGTTTLSSYVSFGYGAVGTPPSNTQTAIGQASACYDTASPPAAIANTACVIFNSRGIPVVDSTGSPSGNYALYINDGTFVYGVTVAATGFIRTWRTNQTSTPSWSLQ
ncbi:MAG TPA: prepilin-type N-terminal cleavage/methylation domain-containing protein [Vicinamibacterales bacterium]|jgi:prepilin-type N-terminal cleavage/methylation domain-containing protein|nr:prepilin-type N-terminal cleavage/methylation domain-containing protein [Vicinamibacterales bacterium]